MKNLSNFKETKNSNSNNLEIRKTYCVIGDPIDHSLSPTMHNAAFNYLKLNSTYIAYRVSKEDLKISLESLKAINIAGFNVTIPHKVTIMKYLDVIDDMANKAQAVNTVKNVDGKFIGYNTDIFGFIDPIHKRKINLNGLKILVIGAGGASRAAITALSMEEGIKKIVIANRTIDNAKLLSKMGSALGLDCTYDYIKNINSLIIGSDLIINTTSLGMNDENSLHINEKSLTENQIVYDIVYKPINTYLIQIAKKSSSKIIYGYEMLLAQGAEAFKIWTGYDPPIEIMKKSLFGIFGEPT